MSTGWESIDAFLTDLGIAIGAPTPGQTTSGGHVAGSEHFQGRARDYGSADSDDAAIVSALLPLAQGPDAPVDELFYAPLNVFFDQGQAITPSDALRRGHYDHVHVGIRPGLDLTTYEHGAGASAQLVSAKSGGGIGGFLSDPFGAVSGAKRIVVTGVFIVGGLALVVVGGIRNVSRRSA